MKAQGKLKVFTKERGAEIGDLFGIFFEDINHAADGGLYAELVRNRSFEFDPIDHPDYHPLTAWDKVERGHGCATITVEASKPIYPRNKHYVVIDILAEGDGVGISNRGFNSGIAVRPGETYFFSCYARRDSSFEEKVRVALESVDGQVHGLTEITVDSSEWKKYEAIIQAEAADLSGRLTIVTKGRGKLYLDMVSLFPSHTFRNRLNGLRRDIAEIIADLKPKFMRFPGGCLVHDGSLHPDDRNSMYRWKNTIGPVEQRPARRNNWRYHQTLGLGYYEYFQFCEDIGTKPIPILPAGYDPHHQRIAPIEELQPWIDDALDLIEFANGDPATPWGAIRAELGHPEPFGLEYIGIGNEEQGEPFFERYEYFHRAIKGKHPEIKLINSSGPFSAGETYERGWKSARDNGSDYVDEHYYMSPEWFLAHHRRYDKFPSSGPKVFLGEYASIGNTYYNALAEAAYMTGLEKNAHAVGLACYAPLLCNADYVNWKPNLIWFNHHEVFGSANYYVQKLFMNHLGDRLLKIEAEGFKQPAEATVPSIGGAITLEADANAVRYRDIRLVNNETGETMDYGDRVVDLTDTAEARAAGTAHAAFGLGVTEWKDYTLYAKAQKMSGPKGLKIAFGKKDDRNHLSWEVGWYQNQDSVLVSAVNGRGSVLTQSQFTVEDGVEYELALHVAGRRVRAHVDGRLLHDVVDELPVIEPIYYSATIEESTGDVIVKVVNLQEEEVATHVSLADCKEAPLTIEVHSLSGHALDEENSFEFPARISPASRTIHSEKREFVYRFPKYSVTIMRIR
ncbi:alpha-L-arabinofuranosidase C-terminal domain-containing protein [Paenibacillus tarimensis]